MNKSKVISKTLEMTTAKGLNINTLIIFTALFSLILSFYQVLNDSVINSDGILYLQLASLIQSSNWHDASKLYNWLFYPYLISETANITGLSLEVAAHLLNAIFTSITCCTFILTVKELSKNSNRLLLLAAITILAFPSINEYRQLIIRDHGYWAFYMVSSYFFIKSFKHQNPTDFILLITFCALSSLFRIEGIVFTIILPFIIFTRTFTSKLTNKNTIKAIYIFTVILSSCILLFGVNEYGKLDQIQTIALNLFSNSSGQEITAISHAKDFLNSLAPEGNYSEGYAPAVLSLTFILILTTEIISSIGLFHTLFIATALLKVPNTPINHISRERQILVIINIIILSTFLIDKFFLAGRYPMALSLTIITIIPSLVNNLFFNHNRQIKHLEIAFIVILSVITIDPFISFGSKKDYLKEAGNWVASSQGGKSHKIFTNSPLIQHYSGTIKTNPRQKLDFKTTIKVLNRKEINKFDLFAIKVSRKNTTGEDILTSLLGANPVNTFKNKKGDKVLIYIRQSLIR